MNNYQEEHKEDVIDYTGMLFKLYRHWYLFVITIFIALFLAFLFNKFTKPIYKATTTVLIQDDKANSPMAPNNFMDEFGFFYSKKTLENEIGILQSYSLINKAINELGLGVSYFIDNNFTSKELYKNSPFVVIYDTLFPLPIDLEFKVILLSDKKYQIEAKGENVIFFNYNNYKSVKRTNVVINGIYEFGENINNTDFRFKILLIDKFNETSKKSNFYFIFNNINTLTLKYQSALNIKPIKDGASIVEVSMKENNLWKASDFLNKLTEVFLRKNLEKKNQIATNTIRFIDEQLAEITDSLHFTENQLQSFRTTNNIMDLTFQSRQLYENMQFLETQRAALIVEHKYYNYLKDYIEKSQNINEILAPSAMGINDLLLNNSISELTRLYAEKTELLFNSKQNNPYINILELKIKNSKNTLLENVQNLINKSNISINDIEKRISELTNEVTKLPKTERELFGIERKFKLNDAIYTYLLQKRSEAQIAKASNLPDNEVIDIAKTTGQKPVYPNKKFNYICAFLLGIILPIIFIFIKDYFDDKIIDKKDIERLTNFPILGHIIHSDKKNNLVVADSPKSSITESFRSVRTNLQFFSQEKEKQILLVTSSLTSEGKTFCAINLASILALSGKKTLLIGFDLRRPGIYKDFGLSNNIGVSSFLINKCSIEEIIQKSVLENLDIITAGHIPPNPAELIASGKTKQLFTSLKEVYDFIVIDTSPIGLVTDALLLMEYSDINIYLVRQNQSHKRVFTSIIKDMERNNKLNNLCILINDVKSNSRAYNYSYSYNYGYGYYEDEKSDEKSFLKRIFSKKMS